MTKSKIKLYRVLPLKRNFINYFKFLFNFYYYLIKINPDVIIQRAYSITTGLSAFYSKIFRKKFLYSIANKSDVDDSNEQGIISSIFKFGLRNADYIVSQNLEQVNLMKKFNNKLTLRTLTLKSGIYLDFKDKNYALESSILWIGRAVNWKRPELFLNLAKNFKNFDFKMVCTKYIDQNYWQNLRKYANKISNLEFINFVNYQDIEQYFKEAKLFINTSVYEGFPNTFLQAFKFRTPVISLNVNPNNIFDDYDIGFYCDDNYDLLKERVLELMQDSAFREKIGNNAFSYVTKFHDIEVIGKQWTKLINIITNKKR